MIILPTNIAITCRRYEPEFAWQYIRKDFPNPCIPTSEFLDSLANSKKVDISGILNRKDKNIIIGEMVGHIDYFSRGRGLFIGAFNAFIHYIPKLFPIISDILFIFYPFYDSDQLEMLYNHIPVLYLAISDRGFVPEPESEYKFLFVKHEGSNTFYSNAKKDLMKETIFQSSRILVICIPLATQ